MINHFTINLEKFPYNKECIRYAIYVEVSQYLDNHEEWVDCHHFASVSEALRMKRELERLNWKGKPGSEYASLNDASEWLSSEIGSWLTVNKSAWEIHEIRFTQRILDDGKIRKNYVNEIVDEIN